MNFAPTEQPDGLPDGQPAEQPVAPPAYVAPVQPVTSNSRGSRRLIAAALVAAAIGLSAVAVAVASSGTPPSSAAPAVANARGVLLGADTGAWTAPNGATAPGPNAPNVASGGTGAFGPGAFGPGGMGRGGPVGGPGGFGSITITSVNLPMITLTTADGWMRTIDTTGATVKRAGQTVDVSTLAKGDAITFSQTRQSDGTYKITSIQVLLPQVDGTVKSVVDNTITVTQRDNTTKDITVTGSTTYRLAGAASSLAAVTVGARLNAQGTDTGGTFTATVVNIQPAMAGGTVTGTGGTSITVKTRDGSSLTINVDATTNVPGRRQDDGLALGHRGRRDRDGRRYPDELHDVLRDDRPGVQPENPSGPRRLAEPGRRPRDALVAWRRNAARSCPSSSGDHELAPNPRVLP